MFKVGDKIRGKKGQSIYGVTNGNMKLAEVVDSYERDITIIIKDHFNKDYVNRRYYVVNSEEYFQLVEEAVSNQNTTQEADENVTFEVGDEVEAFGLKGVVSRISDHSVYPIEVRYEDTEIISVFTSDGRFADHHKKPSLTLIKKKSKKEVKKVKYVALNSKGDIISHSYDDKVELLRTLEYIDGAIVAELHYTVME